MERYRWTRRLLVLLVAVGVSSGWGMRLPSRAGATARPARPEARLVRPQAGGEAAELPTGLAAALRRGRLGDAPATLGLGASGAFTWTQQAELTSTAEVPNDGYGAAVALSGDMAVVGASGPWPSDVGTAYVFARNGGVWTQQAALADPTGVQNDAFGDAVAVSGTTLAVGAPGADGGLGAVYVYGRRGGTWTRQATLTPADATQPENFATALALSGDTLVVGANYQNNGEGAIYIYARTGGVWRQQAEFRYPGSVLYAEFGWSVALSGNTVVVGAPQAPLAYVYVRSGGTWAFQGALQAAHAPALYYGISVAVSGDTALVGACCDALGRLTGAVYVFGRSGGVWTLLATIPPPPGSNGNTFGYTVALSGPTAVVGESGAYVFVGQGNTWSEQAQLIASDRTPPVIGYAVAVAGNTALVGATGTMGAAYVFVRRRVGDQTPADGDTGMALRPAPLGHVR